MVVKAEITASSKKADLSVTTFILTGAHVSMPAPTALKLKVLKAKLADSTEFSLRHLKKKGKYVNFDVEFGSQDFVLTMRELQERAERLRQHLMELLPLPDTHMFIDFLVAELYGPFHETMEDEAEAVMRMYQSWFMR